MSDISSCSCMCKPQFIIIFPLFPFFTNLNSIRAYVVLATGVGIYTGFKHYIHAYFHTLGIAHRVRTYPVFFFGGGGAFY